LRVTPAARYHAWLIARRAQRELAAGKPGAAAALAMQARTLDAASPLANEVVTSVRALITDALPVVHASPWADAIEQVEGWLTAAEAALLARCVAAAPVDLASTAVEIGSYKGRSTLLLALAIAELGSPLRLTAIDPHSGYHFGGGLDTYGALVETLRAHGVDSVVDVIRARSVDVPLVGPIALAFVDGLHDLDSVRADHAHLTPQIVRGGLVVFHDYRELFPGVVEAVNEVMLGDSYELAGWRDSIIALRRR
jgi:predicted O-methyltransferase YrrM